MALTNAQRLDRLKVRLEELAYWRMRESVPVTGWTLDGAPIAVGETWPGRKGVHRFAAKAEVPVHWPLEEARLVLDLGGESLVTLAHAERRPGLLRRRPVSSRISGARTAAFAISRRSDGARAVRRAGARRRSSNRARSPGSTSPVHRLHLLLQAGRRDLRSAGRPRGACRICWPRPKTALMSLDWPSDTAELHRARRALAAATAHLGIAGDGRRGRQRSTRASGQASSRARRAGGAAARPCRSAIRRRASLMLTGHAHIDLAWLWPYDETRRKMRRTFHTALR